MTDTNSISERRCDIAYLVPALFISGGIGVVLSHVLHLRRRGRDARVFVLSEGDSGEWFPGIAEIPVHPVREYAAACGEGGAVHLVATWWETAFDVVAMPARHKHYFLQSLEGNFFDEGHPFRDGFHLSLLLGLGLFTEARWIQRWLKEQAGIEAPLAPNGLDPALFYPPDSPSAPRSKLRILIEGPSSVPFKGVRDGFEAVRGLDVEVWYVSPRDDPDPAWKADRVFKAVPMAGMREIYAACDVLLKLSRIEGVFGPPLEMMACGGTCVVRDVTGHDEYCLHERNCLVVGDPAEARQAVERLMKDGALLRRLKAAGIETAHGFPWESSVDILERQVFIEGRGTGLSWGPDIIEAMVRVKAHLGRGLLARSQLAETQTQLARTEALRQHFETEFERARYDLTQARNGIAYLEERARYDRTQAHNGIAYLEARLKETQADLERHRDLLMRILNSGGWQAVEKCRRLRDRLLPENSAGRKAFDHLFVRLFG